MGVPLGYWGIQAAAAAAADGCGLVVLLFQLLVVILLLLCHCLATAPATCIMLLWKALSRLVAVHCV